MEKKAEVERLLFWDELTGLGNYNHFSAWLTSRLQTMNPDSNHLLVIALDIDHFGVINHALGAHKGDMVLKEIANRLKVFTGDSGTAARFGADEFGLALDIHNKIPLTVIEELRQLISQHPIRLDDNEVSVSASTGLTVYPDDGLQAGQLIERAKMSLSDAKKQGGNQISFYSHELFEKNLKKVEMKRELNEALENLEFVLFFQPKIDLATREIAGFEALIRWQHPQKGLVQPGEFIPFLEESGLIVKVGKWVMEEAIRHIKESPVCKDSRMLISFNVSLKQFEQPGFVQELIETVKASGVDPKRLQIEVTEGLLMKNTRETIEKLARIRDAGLDISIDDFGTGYSSLQYLKYLPASTLKIDYSFVKGLPDEKKDVEIVKTILLLAQGLGKKTVAEGVETREQLVFLAGLGVDEVQGFYFARPMPKGECIKWIEDYRPETYFWPKR
jgi:diguanylate cyclase (GGDEF)-like protein